MQHVRGPFPSFSRVAVVTVTLAVAAGIGAPAAFAQAIYKWVDNRGVVNYGNTDIPKSRDVNVVDVAPPVVVQPDARPRETAARSSKPGDTELLRGELARAREEVARLRQNVAQVNSGASTRNAGGFAEWREDCERQRRVDCDEHTYALESRVGPLIRQPVLVRPPVVVALPKPVPARPGQTSLRPDDNRRPTPKIAGTKPVTTMQ